MSVHIVNCRAKQVAASIEQAVQKISAVAAAVHDLTAGIPYLNGVCTGYRFCIFEC